VISSNPMLFQLFQTKKRHSFKIELCSISGLAGGTCRSKFIGNLNLIYSNPKNNKTKYFEIVLLGEQAEEKNVEIEKYVGSEFKKKVGTGTRVSASQRRNNNLTKLFMQDPSFSDRELRDLVLNMIIAGRDTTSNALSWLTALLAQNPEKQQILCDEVDAAVLRMRYVLCSPPLVSCFFIVEYVVFA
jgi:cytochrome P450